MYNSPAVEVHENKLIVLVNNSHMMKIFDITDEGLSMPGIEVSTNNSGPREMCVVDDKLYFTNWLTKDIKVLERQKRKHNRRPFLQLDLKNETWEQLLKRFNR